MISPSDPAVIIAGIRQFGLAADGSDLRDLEAAFKRMQAMPDLLSALYELIWNGPSRFAWERARDAIDKAEGREQTSVIAGEQNG